ncbi:hypothetical protein BG74_07870 [Sodalis-like endosymbiont of Proechinophthirus fluctus]|uniref:pentapeptide repeat-containing protein n=1 Tax=Sodalis-like endosymbiont of Proechinophthirus fluctus TaxID=1462730 RepID=UPI0007A8B43B|nr:hypothetical protein BG74_07870 [Sodalis-like endosymbiont of Proechinophthirus fluctus]
MTFDKLNCSYLTDADFTGVNLIFANLSQVDIKYVNLSKEKFPSLKYRQIMSTYIINNVIKDLNVAR